MNLLVRLFWLALCVWCGAPRDVHAVSRLHFRVWPHDLGWRDHLPNYRFMSFFELGRFDFWHASRLPFRRLYRTRLIAAQDVVYLRPIPPLARFSCSTRLLGWDEKYCYFAHEVRCGETLMAVGLVKEVFLRGGRVVSPPQVLQLPAQNVPVMQQWQRLQDELKTLC